MERVKHYFANDDKKVGFTYSKACFNFLGLSWWGKPHLLRTFHKPVPLILLYATVYGSINYLLEMEIVDAESFIDMIQYFIIMQCNAFVGIKIFLVHCYSTSCRDAIEATENLQLQHDIKNNTGFAAKIIKLYVIDIYLALIGCLGYGTVKNQGHPIKVSFPFDISTKYPVRFLIVWVVQMFCGFYIGAGNGAIDTMVLLIVNVMVNFGAKLKEILNKIGRNPDEDSLLLQEALEIHNELLKLKDKLIKGFSMITLCQIIYTIFHTCFILFAATKVSTMMFLMILAPILIADYFQLLIYCYAGEILSSTMEELSFSAYDNQWYNSSIATRKNLIRLMEVLKRPIELNSFGIVRACFQTYLNTIKESFSYYVVVKTFATDFK